MPRWKKKSSRMIAESTFFTLKEDEVELPDGTEKNYTMLDIPDFAGVLPVIEDKFILIKNYRYPVDEMVLEIPAGLIEEGEEPLEAASRELEEETGYRLIESEKLVDYHPTASLNTQKAYLYLGKVERGGEIKRDPGEDMKLEMIPIDDVYRMLRNKEIKHPHTIIALHYGKDNLSKII